MPHENFSALSFFDHLLFDALFIDVYGEILVSKNEADCGKMWKEVIPVGIHESFESAFHFCVNAKSVRSIQYPKVEGDSIIWIQYRLSSYEKDQYFGVSVISSDITDQIDTVNELEKMSRSVEQSPTLIVMTNLNGQIEYVNPSYEKLYQKKISELIGTTPVQLKKYNGTNRTSVWESLTRGRSWNSEIEVQRPNDEVGYERVKAFCIQNDWGEITQFCLVIEDITGEYLLKKQLEQTQKIEAIGTLAGGVAHDFNNILMIISGFAEMGLRNVDEFSKAHKSFTTIIEATLRANDLTQSLLSFSRKQELNVEDFEVNDFINALLPIWRRLIPSKIQIHFSASNQEALIRADKVHLEQILMNLIINARDAIEETEKHAADIFMRIEVVDSLVHIYVRDTGSGMSSEVQAKVFEPFFTTKVKGQGTGLGLATVYGLIQQHKASLELESELGVGTEFHIMWPTSGSHEDIVVDTDVEVVTECLPKVLVVDDEDDIRKFCREILIEMGFEVVEASDGQMALEVLQKHEVRLILSDVNMPNATGAYMALHLEPNKYHLIMMSGYNDEIQVLKELDKSNLKSFHVLKKPFSMQDLIRMVQKTIKLNS